MCTQTSESRFIIQTDQNEYSNCQIHLRENYFYHDIIYFYTYFFSFSFSFFFSPKNTALLDLLYQICKVWLRKNIKVIALL